MRSIGFSPDSRASYAAREREDFFAALPAAKVISSEIVCAIPTRVEMVVAHYDRRGGGYNEYLLLYVKSEKHYDIYQSLGSFAPDFWECTTADTVIRVNVEKQDDRRKVAHLANNYYENNTLSFRHLQGEIIGAVPVRYPSGDRHINFVCPVGTTKQVELTPDMAFA